MVSVLQPLRRRSLSEPLTLKSSSNSQSSVWILSVPRMSMATSMHLVFSMMVWIESSALDRSAISGIITLASWPFEKVSSRTIEQKEEKTKIGLVTRAAVTLTRHPCLLANTRQKSHQDSHFHGNDIMVAFLFGC